MVFKKNILSKILSNGLKADFSLVQVDDAFQAALYIDGRRIPGPPLPVPLDPAKDDLTHWMGNRPSVGLTTEEAERIIKEVRLENSVLEHRKLIS
ncbi:MAG TPA: hypothetical protein VN642_17480 [Dongiaceae bacterium]|nr:hypothetical protein [Dongiaceae bacterium]